MYTMNRIFSTKITPIAPSTRDLTEAMPFSSNKSEEDSWATRSPEPSIVQKKPDVKVFGIPLNKRETHVSRSDSMQSKMIRFVRSNRYMNYETKWSKVMIICSVITGLLCVIYFFTTIYYMATVQDYSSIYIKDELLTPDIEEKNKDLDFLNNLSLVNTFISGAVGAVSLGAAVMQFKYTFSHNDFRD